MFILPLLLMLWSLECLLNFHLVSKVLLQHL